MTNDPLGPLVVHVAVALKKLWRKAPYPLVYFHAVVVPGPEIVRVPDWRQSPSQTYDAIDFGTGVIHAAILAALSRECQLTV